MVTNNISNITSHNQLVEGLYSSRLIETKGALSYLFSLDTWLVCNESSGAKDQVIPPTIAEQVSLQKDLMFPVGCKMKTVE